MIDFHNQQIRNEISPAFTPDQGVDYTGRMRDTENASVAGYDIKPFEYADAKLTSDVLEMNSASGEDGPKVFTELFMQKTSLTQKYDFLKENISIEDMDKAEVYSRYQIGQVLRVYQSSTGNYFAFQRVETQEDDNPRQRKLWEPLGLLSKEDLALTPLNIDDIPMPEGQLCLCIKNKDKPLISLSGTDYYDDTDYFFSYYEKGRKYVQKKNHALIATYYREKPALRLEVVND